ncbi:serine--tRNA ligase [Patescibacteria group bacterium]|nr:serine--tRNA ligase [Patescibacteria group bacterium]
MIDIKLLRENPNYFRDAAKAKGLEVDIDRVLELDRKVKTLQSEIENIAAQKNETSKEIIAAEEKGKKKLIEEMRVIDRKADELKAEMTPLVEELDQLLYRIPNPPAPDVKISLDESENEVVREVGKKPSFDFPVRDHLEIGNMLDIIDTKRAAKASGTRFTYLKGDGVHLQLALQQYALHVTQKHGFTPVMVPHLVSVKSIRAMGYLEHGQHDEIYYLPKDNLYLIGTSEQSIGPMHTDEILDGKKLPIRYVGISTCYRREAGAHGKDTRGMIRMHQFDKIEMFSFTLPEDSDDEHELLLSIAEELIKGLGLHYRVVKMVSGDLGLPAARKYDIEAWLPSQEKYLETHSISTTTDFQTRRLNTRYKKDRKTELVHALNGTAIAMSRIPVVILENYQNEDGSVSIPEVLRPYMEGREVLKPSK